MTQCLYLLLIMWLIFIQSNCMILKLGQAGIQKIVLKIRTYITCYPQGHFNLSYKIKIASMLVQHGGMLAWLNDKAGPSEKEKKSSTQTLSHDYKQKIQSTPMTRKSAG